MKRKKVLGLFLTMSLVASMAVPGTAMAASASAVDSNVVYAEEADTNKGEPSAAEAAAVEETDGEAAGILLAAEEATGAAEEEKQISEVTVTSEAELTQAITDAAGATRIIVANDIELTKTLTIASGKEITIEGASEGLSIKAGASFKATSYNMVSSAGILTLKNITLDADGSSSRLWRVLYLNGQCTLEDGVVLTGGYTSSSRNNGFGAGVFVYGSGAILTMKEGSQITGNQAAYNNATMGGGGVAIYGGTLDMQGGSIDNNTLLRGYGGGVFIYSKGLLKMSGNAQISQNAITGSSTSYGGGIASYNGGTYEITGGSISGNSIAVGNGSAIYNNNKNTVLSNVTIRENKAENGIGAVYNNSSASVSLSMENVTMTGNTASSTAAGVYAGANASLSMGGKMVIDGNTVDSVSKNLYFDQSRGKTITLSSPLTEGSKIGAMLNYNAGVFCVACESAVNEDGSNVLTEADLTSAAGAFYPDGGDEYAGYGFGYFKELQSIIWKITDTSLMVTSAQVSTQEELLNALKYASIDEKVTITLKDDIVLTSGITFPTGADITLVSDPEAQKTYTITVDDTSYTHTSNYSLVTVSGNVTINNVIIDAAQKGRAVYVSANASKLTLEDGTVIKNGATYYTTLSWYEVAYGLGVYIEGSSTSGMSGQLIMKEGSQITGCVDKIGLDITQDVNSAKDLQAINKKGLGVYVDANASFIMEGGTISDCWDFGYAENGDRTGISSLAYGGGVYAASDSVFEMTGGSITGNVAYGYGGGVYAEGTVHIGGKAQIAENQVLTGKIKYRNGNHADNRPETCQGGAGIYVTGDVTIDGDAKIADNAAKVEVVTSNGNGDTYRGCGGGIMIADGTVTMNGGSISGNTVSTAENIFVQDTSQIKTYDITESANFHLSNGGGVYVKGGTFTLNGGVITGNKAENTGWTDNTLAGNGGGIFLGYTSSNGTMTSPGTVILNGGTIKNNSSSMKGNDIYVADVISIASGGSSTILTSQTPSILDVVGSPVLQIGAETSNVSVGEVYLPAPSEDSDGDTGEAVISISGALSDTAGTIGILTERAEFGTALAKAGASYALRNTDIDRGVLNYIGADAEEKGLQIDEEGYIVLSAKNTAERTDLSEAAVAVGDVSWSGYVKLPEVTVTLDGKVLTKGTDYVVRYSDNVEPGTATVTVNGVGDYTGTAIGNFTIHPLDISDDSIEVEAPEYKYYSGNAYTPEVNIIYNGTALVCKEGDEESDYDYTVSYSDNTAVGTATVTVTGNRHYTGTRNITFEIKAVPENASLITNETELAEALAKASGTAEDPYKIILANDISLNALHSLAEGQHVEIFGNGYTLTAETANYATLETAETAMFTVPSGASLKLSDVMLDGKLMERLLYVYAGGTLDISSDTVLTRGRAANNATRYDKTLGGQIIWNAGTVSFSGSMTENLTYNNYYGVIYNCGTFVMKEGSSLYRTYAYEYGAIYNDVEGSFFMEGGANNACPTSLLSCGIVVYNYGNFTMTGGEISNNSAQENQIYNCGNFTMAGGKITNNLCKQVDSGDEGGVIKNLSGAVFTMTGGEISYNQGYGYGGAIRNSGTFTVDGADAKIIYNKAVYEATTGSPGNTSSCGGGVFMDGGVFELKNGSISYNTAYFLDTTGAKKAQSTSSCYGLGGGIVIGGGIFRMSGGTVNGNTAPAAVQTSGILVDDGSVYKLSTETVTPAQIEISGNADIQDPIYLSAGKNITITGALGEDVSYTVYQQQDEFKLPENGGKAAAVYASLTDEEGNVVSEEFMNRLDGDKFHPYAYDPAEDYEADASLVYEVDEENRQIVPTKSYSLEECAFVFADADSVVTDPETGAVEYIYNYTGKAMDVEQMKITATAPDGSDINTSDLIYEIEEDADTTNVGEVKVKVTSNRSIYTGETEIAYRIGSIDLTDVYNAETNAEGLVHHTTVTIGNTCVGQEPEISVAIRLRSSLREETLVRDKDYTITYENLNNAGTATAIIEGIGNYKGTITQEFEVDPKALTASDITLESASYMYDGTAKTPAVTVKNGDLVLEEGTDYTVAYANNINIGTATVTVTGIGNYTETVEMQFTIKTAPKWLQNATGWWYQYEDGTYPANCWALINNKWYHFNASGYMEYGWQQINGKWYYLGGANDGAMKTGWQQINGKWYYLGGANDGAMKTGWQQLNGKWYYLGGINDGAMKIGWQWINNKWYYMNRDGVMQTGWVKLGSDWYYFYSNGVMAGSTWIGNYYVKASGAMAKSEWVDNNRYYVDQNGLWVPRK